MLKAYASLLTHRRFLPLALLFGVNFGGLFLYIAAAPHLIYDLLGYGVTDFWVLFIPAVAGIILGSQWSGWVAHRWSAHKSIWVAMSLTTSATLVNLLQASVLPVHPLTAIGPVALYATGMALAMTPISLLAMDLFPLRKGMASALQGFAQTTSNALIAVFLVDLLYGALFNLALGMLGVLLLSWLFWMIYWRQVRAGC